MAGSTLTLGSIVPSSFPPSLQVTEYLNAQEAAKSSRVSQPVATIFAQEWGL